MNFLLGNVRLVELKSSMALAYMALYYLNGNVCGIASDMIGK